MDEYNSIDSLSPTHDQLFDFLVTAFSLLLVFYSLALNLLIALGLLDVLEDFAVYFLVEYPGFLLRHLQAHQICTSLNIGHNC